MGDKKIILHAREYAYPAIDLPEEILERYDIKIIDKTKEAIDFIKQNKNIEAFVLGMTMPIEKYTLNEVDEAFKKADDFLKNVTDSGKKRLTEQQHSKHILLGNNADSLLDHWAGFEIYNFLEKKGYVGHFPTAFFTSHLYLDMINIQKNNKKVSILDWPIFEEDVVEWFDKYLPN
ncbi:MAG: hypothetical protein PHH54_03240 [Candidatus Nanoarchaeia archaeon]|nr:hypothetical protein [Candidatus Nanoarchaeia archaeon]MDD5740971.1 hypothetical protein [Candidatus Nanoarchaeia archaeon]